MREVTSSYSFSEREDSWQTLVGKCAFWHNELAMLQKVSAELMVPVCNGEEVWSCYQGKQDRMESVKICLGKHCVEEKGSVQVIVDGLLVRFLYKLNTKLYRNFKCLHIELLRNWSRSPSWRPTRGCKHHFPNWSRRARLSHCKSCAQASDFINI